MSRKRVCLQGSVSAFIFRDNVLAFSHFLPQLGHLGPQSCILLLQKGSSDCDLVLFQTPSVTRSLCCHIVLLPPGPIFFILGRNSTFNDQKTTKRLLPSYLLWSAMAEVTDYNSHPQVTVIRFSRLGYYKAIYEAVFKDLSEI